MRPGRQSDASLLRKKTHEQRGDFGRVRLLQRLVGRNNEMERLDDARRKDSAPAFFRSLLRKDEPQISSALRRRHDNHQVRERPRPGGIAFDPSAQPVDNLINQFPFRIKALSHFASSIEVITFLLSFPGARIIQQAHLNSKEGCENSFLPLRRLFDIIRSPRNRRRIRT